MSDQTLFGRLETLVDQVVADRPDDEGAATESVKPLAGTNSWKARPRSDLVQGDAYFGRKMTFCPWNHVTNYPEWFIGKKNKELCLPYFKVEDLLGYQSWDFYYIWHPEDNKSKHIILVPTDQIESFLGRINETLSIQLTIPFGQHGKKFRVPFGERGTPMPRFLGHAKTITDLNFMVANMPRLQYVDSLVGMKKNTADQKELYRQKINNLFRTHDKSKPKSQSKVKNHKNWGRQVKHVQRYLGLRGKAGKAPVRPYADGIPKCLDFDGPTPFRPEKDVIFVAMDIESYEFNNRMVTEIGFGIFDTRDIIGVAPGPSGKNWHKLIRGRHIRIREHAHAVNRVHVHGNEDKFNFGTSEFVKLQDIPALLNQILQPTSIDGELRAVVLVGHSIGSDLSFVKNVGFDMTKAKFLNIIDTQTMYGHLCMVTQSAGLSLLMRELDLEYSYMHNGGNDAVYTMQAMISLALETRDASLKRHHERQGLDYKPDAKIVEGGWETGGEMSDGSLITNWKAADEMPENMRDSGKVVDDILGKGQVQVGTREIAVEQAGVPLIPSGTAS